MDGNYKITITTNSKCQDTMADMKICCVTSCIAFIMNDCEVGWNEMSGLRSEKKN